MKSNICSSVFGGAGQARENAMRGSGASGESGAFGALGALRTLRTSGKSKATGTLRTLRTSRTFGVLIAAFLLIASALCVVGCTSSSSSNASASSTSASAGTGDNSGSSAPTAGDSESAAADNASTSEDGLRKVTFVLDYTPNTNHTGIYVADALGYYADAGIELEIVQPPDDGADALVGTGKAEFGVSYQDIMANYLGSDQPLPVTAIAALVQHNTSGIISRAEDGIKSPKDLAGKRYATWEQDVEKAILRNIVELDGGAWDDVQLIPAGFDDEVSGLRANMFDAIWCYEGWAVQNANVQGFDYHYFNIADVNEVFDYYTPVIIANNDVLEQDPELAQAFLAATMKGYEYAIANPEQAAEILVKAAPEIDSDLAQMSQQFLADKYVADAASWGCIDPTRWNRFYAWMSEEGLVSVPIAEGTGFTDAYLPQ